MYKLKIGGHTFHIVQKDLNKDEDLGSTNWDTGEITIHSGSIRTIKESSLIHEIFHVLNPTMDSSDDGHRILESIAEQLYQVLADNGMLMTDHLLGREEK